MRIVHKVTAYLIVSMGIIHILVTPFIFDQFTMRVMWFVAQGVMGVYLGFLNILLWRSSWQDRIGVRICQISNMIGTVFVVLYSIVDRALQSFVGIIVMLFLTVSALKVSRKTRKNGQGLSNNANRANKTNERKFEVG